MRGLRRGWGFSVESCPWQPHPLNSTLLFALLATPASGTMASIPSVCPPPPPRPLSELITVFPPPAFHFGLSDPNPARHPQVPRPQIPSNLEQPLPLYPLLSIPSCLGEPNPPQPGTCLPTPLLPSPSRRLQFALQLPEDLQGLGRRPAGPGPSARRPGAGAGDSLPVPGSPSGRQLPARAHVSSHQGGGGIYEFAGT